MGPLDLSFNLGCPKQYDYPDLRAATNRVIAACRDQNKAAGILSSVDGIDQHIEQGFTFVAVGSDAGAAGDGLAQLLTAGKPLAGANTSDAI